MPPRKLEYSCPICKQQSGATNQIMASDMRLVCTANPSHAWSDTQSFLDLQPTMEFKVAAQVFAPQQGHVEVKVLIPPRVKDALELKWGARLNPTVAGVLEVLAEGEALMLSQGDVEKLKLSEFLGSKPGSSAELCGQVYALRQEITEAKNEAENARKDVAAYENHSPGRVVIDISSFQQGAVEKARDANMPVKIWIETNLKNAIENSWF
jgi:hypothetical protein